MFALLAVFVVVIGFSLGVFGISFETVGLAVVIVSMAVFLWIFCDLYKEDCMLTKCIRRKESVLVVLLQLSVCISLIVLFVLEILGKI